MTYTKRISGIAAATAVMVAMAGCKNLDVGNLNGVSAEGLQNAPTAQQIYTAAQSLESSWRSTDAAHASTLTKYGFEHWQVRASEPRTLTDIVTSPNTGSFWSYGTQKNIDLLLSSLGAVTGMTDQQKAAVRGWLKMNLAIQIHDMAQAHDTFGVVIDLPANPETDIPEIKGKVDVWTRIFTLMDEAYTEFGNAGTVLPFRLHSGFASVNTPAGMRRLNRAMKARWLTTFAVPLGLTDGARVYNVTDWNNVLTAITDAGFFGQAVPATPIPGSFMRTGPFHVYTSDQTNGLSATDRYSNYRIRIEAQCKAAPASGTCSGDSAYAATATSTNRDDRAYGAGAKVFILPPASALSFAGVTTNLRHTDFVNPQAATASIGSTSPLPIIRNEELLLLRAEANYNLGNNSAAIADINRVRQSAIVNLPAISDPYVPDATLNQPSTLLNELLYEKRFSLWGEIGTVWVDMRHYGRAFEIPHYAQAYRIIDIFPFPIAECDIRKYRGEGGPNGCYRGGYGGLQNGPNLLFQPL